MQSRTLNLFDKNPLYYQAAMLDANSPARGLLKRAEAERLAHVTEPKNSIEFVKGGTQPASEGAI